MIGKKDGLLPHRMSVKVSRLRDLVAVEAARKQRAKPIDVEPDDVTEKKSCPRRMLKEKQVLELVPISRTTLYRMEKARRFPRSTYISANRRVWFEDEIIAWQNTVDEFNPKRGRGKGKRRHTAT